MERRYLSKVSPTLTLEVREIIAQKDEEIKHLKSLLALFRNQYEKFFIPATQAMHSAYSQTLPFEGGRGGPRKSPKSTSDRKHLQSTGHRAKSHSFRPKKSAEHHNVSVHEASPQRTEDHEISF